MPASPLTPQQESALTQALSLHQAGRVADARVLYRQLLAQQPRHHDILRLLGTAEYQLGRIEEGVRLLGQSLAIVPNQPNAQYNRGNALQELGRFDEAVAAYDKAVALQPGYVLAWNNRGVALQNLGRPEDAVASYDKVLTLQPDFVEALNNRGNTLLSLKRVDAAVADYDRALALNPGFPWLTGQALHARLHLADWTQYPQRKDRIAAGIAARQAVCVPFQVQSLIDSADIQRQASDIFVAARYPSCAAPDAMVKPPAHDRIRIAYVSSDFKDHPVSHLMAGVLERHDRAQFEIYALAFGSHAEGPWRTRMTEAADHFIDISNMSDSEAAARMRDLGIDIAVDLNGHTDGSRMGLFAARAAPVQASYIGYLGTMAAPCYDYLLADAVLIPPDRQRFYSEKIVYLPSYQANDDRTTIAPQPSRREAGLPDSGFVFCAFNTVVKITPEVFESWMRILAQVPDSVLWLYVDNATAMANLKAAAHRQGIASERLVFAGRVPLEAHVARQKLADLFLDTHPYNAGATASAALRAGLPVLTRMGDAFASRMGASLLTAAGLPELITATPEAYEALAVQLARTPDQLKAVKEKLAHNLPTCALFDTARFTRTLEAAYTAMHERHHKGQAPDSLTVPAP